MSDFVIREKEARTLKTESFSFVQVTKKDLSLVFRLIAFFGSFFGLIYLSISSDSLLLTEILTIGSILSIVFFIHTMSNR